MPNKKTLGIILIQKKNVISLFRKDWKKKRQKKLEDQKVTITEFTEIFGGILRTINEMESNLKKNIA